ncbi:MAG: YybH family protein [Acidobacteriaceae bacterium]
MRTKSNHVTAFLVVIALISAVPAPAQRNDKEAEVRSTIEAFYKAFDDGFTSPADYAAEDWNHINPFGGRTRGRKAVLKEVREVHQSFLKGTTENIESMDIRFATSDVAVGTVVSVGSAFTSPDGVKHEPGRAIRTFVVVRRGKRWQIMQDQNTLIQEPH